MKLLTVKKETGVTSKHRFVLRVPDWKQKVVHFLNHVNRPSHIVLREVLRMSDWEHLRISDKLVF